MIGQFGITNPPKARSLSDDIGYISLAVTKACGVDLYPAIPEVYISVIWFNRDYPGFGWYLA